MRGHSTARCVRCTALALAISALAVGAAHADEATPWRLAEELGAPAWLTFGLEHRQRFEHLDNDFRAGATGNPTALAMRTLVEAEVRYASFHAGLELIDARAYASGDAPITTSIVDTLDVLRAWAGLRLEGVLAEGDALALAAGRMTLDVGSRRLVARNAFRNTINAFTGIDLRWEHDARSLRAFAVVPVRRLPADAEALADNAWALDRESTDALLWGAFGELPLASALRLEGYVLGLHERDAGDAPSPARQLITPGFRVLRARGPRRLDLELEAMLQLGTSNQLAHRAVSVHASAGYTLDTAWKPRVAAFYDLASGDDSPTDDVNGRFDPLFGARRFDFGPTSLYGPFARSNASSPGLRIQSVPHRRADAFATYRAVWLASARDAWIPAGVRDPSGASGRFVGHQLEARVRWRVVPGNLDLELDAAYLIRGRFAREAPGTRDAPALYLAAQLTGTI